MIIPYNTLLHKPTRDSIGIKLKNSVVIIDEAHNLLDTISHIHSSEVRGDQLLLVQVLFEFVLCNIACYTAQILQGFVLVAK